MDPQQEKQQLRRYELSDDQMTSPELIRGPVAAVSFQYVDGEIEVTRIGAFRSGSELAEYIKQMAEQVGGFHEDFTIHIPAASEISFRAVPLASALDGTENSDPVAVFHKDEVTGEPIAIGPFPSLEAFKDQCVFEQQRFWGKEASFGSSRSDDVAVTHQSLEDEGYVVVSIGEFIR